MTVTIGCGVCGADAVLGVDIVVKAAEIATFASAHADHGAFRLHLTWLATDPERSEVADRTVSVER